MVTYLFNVNRKLNKKEEEYIKVVNQISPYDL